MSLTRAREEIDAVEAGRAIDAGAILARIRQQLAGVPDPRPPAGTIAPSSNITLSPDLSAPGEDFSQTVVQAIGLLRRQALDNQAYIETVEDWIRAETEWNARANHEVCERLDRLAGVLESLAMRTAGIGDRLDQLERRLDTDLAALRELREAPQVEHGVVSQEAVTERSRGSAQRLLSMISVHRGRKRS